MLGRHLDECAAASEAAVEAAGSNALVQAEVKDTLSWVLRRRGDVDRARAVSREALRSKGRISRFVDTWRSSSVNLWSLRLRSNRGSRACFDRAATALWGNHPGGLVFSARLKLYTLEDYASRNLSRLRLRRKPARVPPSNSAKSKITRIRSSRRPTRNPVLSGPLDGGSNEAGTRSAVQPRNPSATTLVTWSG
jgi:hypothetical protein